MVEEVLDSFFAEDLALIVDIVRFIYSNWMWECGGGCDVCRLFACLFVCLACGDCRWCLAVVTVVG